MSTIGELIVKIGADASDLSKGLETASQKIEAVGSKMKALGGTMTAALTLPIAAAGTAAVKLASDMDESLNKVDVAFKENSQEIKDWSEDTLNKFGIAKGTALDMAATYGDMATGMGLSTKQAADMSKSMVGLAGDLASFKNISIDIANTALTGIFTGETESLKQLGIVMTQANLQEFAYSQGIKTKIQDMTQAEQVQLRYNYVMAMTTNAQGDFERTGAGTANQMRVFTESLKELGATIGQNLLPLITPIITKLNEWVQKFGELDSSTQKIILVVAGIAAAIGPVLVIIGTLISAVGAIAGAFGAASAAITAAGGVMAIITGPVGIAVAAIAGLIALAVLIVKNWGPIKEFFSNLWESISTTFSNKWNAIKNTASNVWNGIKDFFKKWGDEILLIAAGPAGWVVLLATKIAGNWDTIKKTAEKVWGEIKMGIGNIWTNITSSVETSASNLYSTVKGKLEDTWNYIKSIPSQALQWGKDIIQRLVDGFKSIHIPIPHFSIGWDTKSIAGKSISVPDFDVNWYGSGGIFTSPSIIGVGERGPEAVVPLNRAGGFGNIFITGNTFNVRDDSDINKIAEALAKKQREYNQALGVK